MDSAAMGGTTAPMDSATMGTGAAGTTTTTTTDSTMTAPKQ